MANKQVNNNKGNNTRPNNNKGGNKSYNGKGKGSKTGFTAQEAAEHNNRGDMMSSPKGQGHNDEHWYYTDEAMMEQISRFPMNQFAGMGKINDRVVPAVMTIQLAPHLVNTDLDMVLNTDASTYKTATSNIKMKGINLSAQKWWTVLTVASGRGSVYTKNDIAILFGAVGEIISMYEFCRRPFGVTNSYSLRNRALPRTIIEAMGIDYDDFIQNIPSYRIQLNTLVTMINQLPIPAKIAYFAKCQYLYQNIYMDENSEMCQFYMYVPGLTWKLNEASISSGSVLETVPVTQEEGEKSYVSSTTRKKFSDYLNILKDMVDALLSSSTYSIIYADILNVSTRSGLDLWHFDTVKEDYVIVPLYDEVDLNIIHNTINLGPVAIKTPGYNGNTWVPKTASANGYYSAIHANDVVCDPDLDVVLQATPIYGQASGGYPSKPVGNGYTIASSTAVSTTLGFAPMADFNTMTPDVKVRVDSTRYLSGVIAGKTILRFTSDGKFYLTRLSLPDHFCVGVDLWRVVAGGTQSPQQTSVSAIANGVVSTSDELAQDIAVFSHCMPSRFKQGLRTVATGNEITIDSSNVVWDVDCYTLLDTTWVDNVNDACYVALFDIR